MDWLQQLKSLFLLCYRLFQHHVGFADFQLHILGCYDVIPYGRFYMSYALLGMTLLQEMLGIS